MSRAIRADDPSTFPQDAPVAGAPRFEPEPLAGGDLALWRRALESARSAALAALPDAALPALRHHGPAETLAADLAHLPLADRGLAAFLRDDILALAGAFVASAGAARLRLRLQPVAGDGCSLFHADALSHRLICTYRGAATEWIAARDRARVVDGEAADGVEVRRLAAGWAGLMRGRSGAAPGLLHRSPRAAATARLVLTIDDAADFPAAAL